ncbi:hypothetical protein LMG33818_001699 [Halomonadaceae bacterium LMG 33818]
MAWTIISWSITTFLTLTSAYMIALLANNIRHGMKI